MAHFILNVTINFLLVIINFSKTIIIISWLLKIDF